MSERIHHPRGRPLPHGAVWVGRGSQWENPFIVRRRLQVHPIADDTPAAGEPRPGRWEWAVINLHTGEHLQTHAGRYGVPEREARRQCVDLYTTITLPHRIETGALDPALLAGMQLACDCPPEAPCHADTLATYAEEPAWAGR